MKVLIAILLAAVFVMALDDPKYTPSEAAARAATLIGKSRSEYQCNHVVNYAFYGNKNYGYLAKDYLKFGEASSSLKTGCAVVAKNGVHVGIISADGNLIHSSSSKYQVIKVPLSQLKYVFPSGYVVRCY